MEQCAGFHRATGQFDINNNNFLCGLFQNAFTFILKLLALSKLVSILTRYEDK